MGVLSGPPLREVAGFILLLPFEDRREAIAQWEAWKGQEAGESLRNEIKRLHKKKPPAWGRRQR